MKILDCQYYVDLYIFHVADSVSNHLRISRSISVKCRIWSVIHVQDELLHLLKILFNWSTMNILCFFLTIRCVSYDNIRSFLPSYLARQIFRPKSVSDPKRANYFFLFQAQAKNWQNFFDKTRISIRGGGWCIIFFYNLLLINKNIIHPLCFNEIKVLVDSFSM
jgi:hypothetical protein